MLYIYVSLIFFFTDTATTEIYTLSLHDALPISTPRRRGTAAANSTKQKIWYQQTWHTIEFSNNRPVSASRWDALTGLLRSEEHTSELQSQSNLVCRLLLEKKKKTKK